MKTRLLAGSLFILTLGLVPYAPAFSKENPVPSQIKNCPLPPPEHDSKGRPLPPPRDWYAKCLSGTGTTAGGSDAAQIVTDENNKTVRVLIGGKEILTIDAQGLHVNGDIQYAGKIRNTGKSGTWETPTAP
jgi:hypothetical protein